MRTTIDKAGKVVIPAAIRERVGMTPGAGLEIIEDDSHVRRTASASEPSHSRAPARPRTRP